MAFMKIIKNFELMHNPAMSVYQIYIPYFANHGKDIYDQHKVNEYFFTLIWSASTTNFLSFIPHQVSMHEYHK